MANTLLTSTVLAREALMILENNLVMANLVNRSYANEFTSGRQGDSINIRRPTNFAVNDFNPASPSLTTQDITEQSTTLQLEKFSDVTFVVSAKEMTLSIDDFSNMIMKPAIVAMAQQIDAYVLQVMRDGSSGVAEVAATGTAPSTVAHVAAITQRLNEQKAPVAGRHFVVSPGLQASLMGIDEFVQAQMRADGGVALREASLGRFMGLDLYMSQNVPTLSGGTARSDSQVASLATSAAASKNARSISLTGLSGSKTILKGENIRVTHSDGTTKDYVATAASTAGFNSATALPIEPPLYSDVDSGANVDIVITGTGLEQNVAFNSDAVALVMTPLDEPLGPGTDSSVVSHNGYSMRTTITYDHATKQDKVSIDCVYGAKVIQPEMTCKMPTS